MASSDEMLSWSWTIRQGSPKGSHFDYKELQDKTRKITHSAEQSHSFYAKISSTPGVKGAQGMSRGQCFTVRAKLACGHLNGLQQALRHLTKKRAKLSEYYTEWMNCPDTKPPARAAARFAMSTNSNVFPCSSICVQWYRSMCFKPC